MLVKSHGTTDNFDISWIIKDTQCWVYFPQEELSPIYAKAIIKGIIPLSFTKANSKVMCQLENGEIIETKAGNLEKRRHSTSLQKDLIQLQIINGAEIMDQLQRRFELKKIHIYLWNSLIIVNPFHRIQGMYQPQVMNAFTQKVIYQKKKINEVQPHIYGFICNILNNLKLSANTQFISISGESGSGKTQTNKQCLRIISHVCEAHLDNIDRNNSLIEERILNCDFILECFGNAKTQKNDNSSRFGKLITEKINVKSFEIVRCEIKGFFLEKSRIVHQFQGERNFHIFYQLINFSDQNLKRHLKLNTKKNSSSQFSYLGNNTSVYKDDYEMWENLRNAFDVLDFDFKVILHIYQIVAAILHIGNLRFDDHTLNDHDPCEIQNDELVPLIANLLMIDEKQLHVCLVFHKKNLAGQIMFLPMTEKQCREGRDSMAKALYQRLFLWIVSQLTKKVNQGSKSEQHIREIKMLDIYGFEVFEYNSFEQLNVNYTNQRIHQVYLDQVFKNQKLLLQREGLGNAIPDMKFTDNRKIIDMLDTLPKSIYNLLDESCSLNVRDSDFLENVKKTFEGHENFPAKNNITTKRCFLIQHTPGIIEYSVDGFRDKNKDFVREDIVEKLSASHIQFVRLQFTENLKKIRSQQNKKFLGYKMRKEVNNLILEMSNKSDLHFIRCIKPNQEKKALTFIDRVCYNQIKYLGILDTILMRKQCYHVRIDYLEFYRRYGILNKNIREMIEIERGNVRRSQCKEKTQSFLKQRFKDKKLDYLLGNDRIFMKMETHNFFEVLLRKQMERTSHSCTVIKTLYRFRKNRNRNLNFSVHVQKIQRSMKRYLREIKLIKKKKAVRIIEREWIKRCDEYFTRKKRNPLMVLQKYIKRAVWKTQKQHCLKNMKNCKQILQALAKGHRQANKYNRILHFKQFIRLDLFNSVWDKIKQAQIGKIERCLKTFRIQQKYEPKIYRANQLAKNKLILRSKTALQKYLLTVPYAGSFQKFRKAVLKIQRNYRMSKCRRQFRHQRQKIIFIQRQWRRYKYNKISSIMFTQSYFSQVEKLQRQMQDTLFRDAQSNSLGVNHHGFEKILDKFQKFKKQKITFFYYLLDFHALCDDISLQNWLQTYMDLSEETLLKFTPIQFVDINDSVTVASTINKIYSWGCIDLQNNKINTQKVFPVQQCIINQGKINKVFMTEQSLQIQTCNPPKRIQIGDTNQSKDDLKRQWSTLTHNFSVLNGVIITLEGYSNKMRLPEKVAHISCGMGHVICKTILKKVYTWGNNENGQLGVGHYNYVYGNSPMLVDYFIKKKIQSIQVAAGAKCSVVLDSNSKIYWFGSNGTIQNYCYPQQCLLSNKSYFIGNSNKYCPARLIVRWSKTKSIIGVTMACYDGVLKNQISLRKKIIEMLTSKWNEDINTINLPYIQNIADYIAQKHMPLPPKNPQQFYQKTSMTNKEARNKIISEIQMIEQAQRELLKQRKQKNQNQYNSKYRPSKPY